MAYKGPVLPREPEHIPGSANPHADQMSECGYLEGDTSAQRAVAVVAVVELDTSENVVFVAPKSLLSYPRSISARDYTNCLDLLGM